MKIFNLKRNYETLSKIAECSDDVGFNNTFVGLCCDAAKRKSDYVIVSDGLHRYLTKAVKSVETN